MAIPHLAIVPVGKVDAEELKATLVRVAKSLRRPVELRDKLPVPQGVEDTGRRQFQAAPLIARLATRLPQLGPGEMIGADGDGGKAPPRADAHLFVTDVDLFTAKSDQVFAALNTHEKLAVVSVRRLREAFYRRPADPTKHRARLVKEIVRMTGRLAGARECGDPNCALSGSKNVIDIDLKEETFCRACSLKLFEGTIRL